MKPLPSSQEGPLRQGVNRQVSKSVPRGRSCLSTGLVTVPFLRRLGHQEEGVCLNLSAFLVHPGKMEGQRNQGLTCWHRVSHLERPGSVYGRRELPGRDRSGLRVEAEPNALDLCLMNI